MKELTIEEYNKEMNKIIAMGLPVSDTLVIMLEFAGGVKIVKTVPSNKDEED